MPHWSHDPVKCKAVGERISIAVRGRVGTWKGKHLPESTKKKLSEAARKQWQSAGMRQRMVAGMVGKMARQQTDEMRQRTSARMSGHAPTSQCIEAAVKVTKLRWQNAEFRRKYRGMTAAIKSEAAKKRWADPDYRDRVIRAILKASRIRPTTPELQVQAILDVHFPGQWKYTGDGDVIIGGKNPDFVNVNGQKSVIEMFGDYWHGEKRTGIPNEQAVADRIAHFAKYGFRCAVVWESDTRDDDVVLSKLRVAGIVGGIHA